MSYKLTKDDESQLIDFYRKGIQTRSYSNEEKNYAELIRKTMESLGFDSVGFDEAGNVVGRVGNGEKIIHFDSHMDTVRSDDADEWKHGPFSAAIDGDYIYGRGSVDMKGGLSASVFAAAAAKKQGLLGGKTVYVTGTVCEEYCDGVNLQHFYKQYGLKPDYCVICEPSGNLITLGHTGKFQAEIITTGVSAHGSAPEKGINAVYEMAEIITRVDELNKKLRTTPNGGSIVLSDISSKEVSLNAVPHECKIYLDRRLKLGETLEQVMGELDELVRGKRATWRCGTLVHTSWTGKELVYEPMHDPWKMPREHEIIKAADKAYEETFGRGPEKYEFWDFGTNAVTPISMGVPCMGFGPGEYKLAHMRDERCTRQQVIDAGNFYLNLITNL